MTNTTFCVILLLLGNDVQQNFDRHKLIFLNQYFFYLFFIIAFINTDIQEFFILFLLFFLLNFLFQIIIEL